MYAATVDLPESLTLVIFNIIAEPLDSGVIIIELNL